MEQVGQRTPRISPGFATAVGFQETFRSVLEAMSRPGKVLRSGATLEPPGPIPPALGAVCLTLLDFETPLWTDLPPDGPAVRWLRFHCGAPPATTPGEAAFALITRVKNLCPLGRFHSGEEERPERGGTVMVQVEGLEAGEGWTLRGPGIEDTARLRVYGLPPGFQEERAALEALFPLGLDFIFSTGERFAALPRTTRIEV